MDIEKQFTLRGEAIFKAANLKIALPCEQGILPEVKNTTLLRCKVNGKVYDEAVQRIVQYGETRIAVIEYVEKAFTPEAIQLLRSPKQSLIESRCVYEVQEYGGLKVPLIRYRLISGNYYFEQGWQFKQEGNFLALQVNIFDADGNAVRGAVWENRLAH